MLGSLCYAHNQKGKRDKFASRSHHCIFVGYPYGQKGWKLYDLNTNEYFVSQDVDFFQMEFPFAQKDSNGSENLSENVFPEVIEDDEFEDVGNMCDSHTPPNTVRSSTL